MPTYQYECQRCGNIFERFQKISDPPLKVCSKLRCKGRVKRMIGTGAGIIFKGSGFYSTDYRSESYKAAHNKEKGSKESSPEKKQSTQKTKSKDSH
jgi:putative FmdB family regulatory protein